MRRVPHAFMTLIFLTPLHAKAQVLRLGSDNKKTIEATTTEKISVPSDSAIVKIGFNHVADTKDSAYGETVRQGAKIIKALTDAGIPKEEIQTESVSVGRDEEPTRNASSPPKVRYSAEQQWREQSAAQAGVKLGELISIINGEESEGFAKLAVARKMALLEVEATPVQNLVLYPGRVEREATVTVIYAVAP